jgi:hypothetical protein
MREEGSGKAGSARNEPLLVILSEAKDLLSVVEKQILRSLCSLRMTGWMVAPLSLPPADAATVARSARRAARGPPPLP